MLKDLLNLRPMTKTLVFMFLIFGIVFIPMGNTMTVYFLLMIFAALLPMTSLTMDDMAKWDRYALTMPVTRKDIVTSKYLMTIIFFCVAIRDFGNHCRCFVLSDAGELRLRSGSSFSSVHLAVFYGSLLFPLLYKFGSEKARYMMFVLMAVIGILLVGWFALFGESLTGNLLIYILITAVVSVAAFIASYFVSVRLYEKKEF